MPVQIQGKTFGLPNRSQGKLKMANPIPISKDFIYTTIINDVVQATGNNALPNGINNTPFYIDGVSASYTYVLTASPTIFRTADVYFEFAFNANDAAARQQSRWFNDSGSITTEQHIRGVCNGQAWMFNTPIFVPNSSNFFYLLKANGVDPAAIVTGGPPFSTEISIQVFGHFV